MQELIWKHTCCDNNLQEMFYLKKSVTQLDGDQKQQSN